MTPTPLPFNYSANRPTAEQAEGFEFASRGKRPDTKVYARYVGTEEELS